MFYLKPSKRRGSKRGVVYVEAIVVSMLLVLFLSAVFFFHKLYATKLATLREARFKAWSESLPGCGGVVTKAAMEMARLADPRGGDNVCSEVDGNDCAGGSALGFAMAFSPMAPVWAASTGTEGVASESVSTKGGEGSFHINWSGTISTETRISCNEVTQAGKPNLIGVASYAAALLFDDPFGDHN